MSRSDFAHQKVVVTGGSSGLGLALAARFASLGAHVALVARDEARLQQARSTVIGSAPGASVLTATMDVSRESALPAAFESLAERLGGIDMLVNSAGIMREGYFEELLESNFREVMEVNFFGLLGCTRAALPHLKRARGRVVNIASAGGLIGVFGYTAYNASKFAVVGLSESLRYELKPQGVGVHLVCPPEFQTPMIDALDASRTPENRAHTLTIPKHRIGTIVDGTVAGLARGQFMIIPGSRARAAVSAARHFPAVGRALGDLRIRTARGRRTAG